MDEYIEAGLHPGNLNFLQPPLLQFYNPKEGNTPIGTLDVDAEGFLTFEGDVDESAKKLFEGVIAHNSTKLKQYRDALLAIRNKINDEEIQKIIRDVL